MIILGRFQPFVRHTSNSRRQRRALLAERLEGRMMLAADPVITEFVASNGGSLVDGSTPPRTPDWIEIRNVGDAPADLAGWHLTDDPANPTRWTFPATPLAAGEFLVVFASGDGVPDAAGNLHANFSLNADGEYLALVRPDMTIASEFSTAGQNFPAQRTDVSYGIANETAPTTLLSAANAASVLVPASAGQFPADWFAPSFDASGWLTGPAAIGFDAPLPPQLDLVNVAPGGTATQSTTNAAFTANLAIDGNNGNFTHTLGADSNPTWQLILNGSYDVAEIVINNRTSCCLSRLRDIRVTIRDAADTTDRFVSDLLNPENVLGGGLLDVGPTSITLDLVALTGGTVDGGIIRITRVPDPDLSGSGGGGNADEAAVLSLAEVQVLAVASETMSNLALAGAATQSTTNGAFAASLAVDGNLGNFTHTLSTDPNPTWQVNLGGTFDLDNIVIRNRGDGCCQSRLRDIRVTIRDAADTTDLFVSELLNPENILGNHTTAGPATLSLDLVALTGSHVSGGIVRVSRIPDPDNSGVGGVGTADEGAVLSLGEVQVFGLAPASTAENVAAGKPVIQSTTNAAYGPELAVDGNLGNFTHTAAGDPDPTWELDLTAPHEISRIVVRNRGDGCCQSRLRDITVDVLESDAFTVAWSSGLLNPENILGGGTLNGPANFDLDLETLAGGPVFGQFVRIRRTPDPDLSGTGGQGNPDEPTVLSLGEVQVFGVEVPRYQPLIETDLYDAMRGVTATALVRVPFTVADAAAVDVLTIRMRYDDGFAAYLNGTLVASRNAPAAIAWDSTATAERADDAAVAFESIDISAFRSLLVDGNNVLAIAGLNFSAGDDDFLLSAELVATDVLSSSIGYMAMPTPGTLNGPGFAGFVADTTYSGDPLTYHGRGFYDDPFDVTLATATAGATLVYTTDGSPPTLSHGTIVAPADTATPPSAVVPISTTTTLRVAAFKQGFEPSNVDTQTYIFLDDVLTQTGAGQPTSWNGFPADYAMDPNVVNNPAYAATIKSDLQAIPTMSIVMDPADLFGPASGIYTFPEARGDAWERGASIELINTDGTSAFQIDAGVSMFGFGFRPHTSTPKHAFHLSFKSQYGASKLQYPLFADSPVDKFDDLILRAQGNASWGDFRTTIQYTQYIHDSWARDTMRDMGDLTTHATYVNLYINGLYWGLYNPVERPDAGFMSEYQGGEKEEYFALNARTGTIEAIDGGAAAIADWDSLIALADSSAATAAGYAQIAERIDIDNLMDYVLVNFYGGNKDWPGNNGNNMRVSRRNAPGYKWTSFVWDVEWNFQEVGYNATGINTSYRSPTRIHTRLMANPEYKIRFADRAYQHLYNDGNLTPAQVAARWMVRAAEIDRAVVGESARWGDARREPPYTRDVEWIGEQNRLLTQYFPQRTGILIGQLRSAGAFPTLEAPAFNQHGGEVSVGFDLTMSAPSGAIYYTLDGTDPRLTGGALNPNAVLYTAAVELSDATLVKARTLLSGQWSPLDEALFSVGSPIRVTEIMYHPREAAAGETFTDRDQYEYVELQNTSDETVNLAGYQFTAGVAFTFPAMSLAAGERTVVVANATAFAERYPAAANIAGQYAGNLSNGGETLALSGPLGEVIQSFSYDDAWYAETDGPGKALLIVNPLAAVESWDLAASWRAGREVDGSPGSVDVLHGDANLDDRVDLADVVLVQTHIGLNVGATRGDGDLNGDGAVDRHDAAIVARGFGRNYPAAAPIASAVVAQVVGRGSETNAPIDSPPASAMRLASARRRPAARTIDRAVDEVLGDSSLAANRVRRVARISQTAHTLRDSR
ncbi:MAG: lamin tail domain-containing protein [Pirellulales bacterium]